MTLFPISAWLPITVGDAVASVTLPEIQEISQVSGSLQTLASGTLVVRVRDQDGNLIGTLSWSQAGTRKVAAASFPTSTRLDFDVLAIGTGAVGLYLSVWCNPFATSIPLVIDPTLGLTAGLISYWKMDEASGTRYDAVMSNHLTDNNTVTAAAGKISDAAQFTAANSEYLSIADDPSLRVGTDSFTFGLWIYLDSGVMNKCLVYKLTAYTAGYSLRVTSNEFLRLDIGSSGPTSLLHSVTLSMGTWYFVLAGVDAPGALAFIQLDNATMETTALVAPQVDGPEPFWVGGTSGSEWMDGRIDSLSFWNRLLTTDEKTALYNGGAGLAYPFLPPA